MTIKCKQWSLSLYPLSPCLTASQQEVVLLPLILLISQLLAAVQESLNTGCTIHDVFTLPLTVVWEGGFPHTIQTTVTFLFFFILAHWKEERDAKRVKWDGRFETLFKIEMDIFNLRMAPWIFNCFYIMHMVVLHFPWLRKAPVWGGFIKGTDVHTNELLVIGEVTNTAKSSSWKRGKYSTSRR